MRNSEILQRNLPLDGGFFFDYFCKFSRDHWNAATRIWRVTPLPLRHILVANAFSRVDRNNKAEPLPELYVALGHQYGSNSNLRELMRDFGQYKNVSRVYDES